MSGPPPPPPPHGENPRTASGLPPGNYDIFIIPPNSSGGGFLYLPSLQPNRNSFLAGCACALIGVSIWSAIAPALKTWIHTQSQSGTSGVFVLVMAVGVAAWAFGKTQGESGSKGDGRASGGGGHGPGPGGAAAGNGAGPGATPGSTGPPPEANGYANTGGFHPGSKPAGSGWQQRQQSAGGASWEKAREETRRREEERRAAEEARKKREEAEKKKEEAEKKAREAAERDKWEKSRAREKEAREREAREKLARERLAREKEAREGDAKEREAREKAKRAAAGSTATPQSSPKKKYERPTAKSYVGTEEDAHSFRPYDIPNKRPAKTASSSSIYSESSYAPSQTTARTTPPPSHRGPYTTKDPDKVVIKAVYLFNDSFPKPAAQLVTGVGSVTDGLILRIATEGLFIDDDVRNIGQREWDVKAWAIKLVEVSSLLS